MLFRNEQWNEMEDCWVIYCFFYMIFFSLSLLKDENKNKYYEYTGFHMQ